MFASREGKDSFDPAVRIQLGPLNDIRKIRSPREAAFILFDEWPETAGPAYVAALRACLAASRGKISVAHARLALVKAGRESGILAELQSSPSPSSGGEPTAVR